MPSLKWRRHSSPNEPLFDYGLAARHRCVVPLKYRLTWVPGQRDAKPAQNLPEFGRAARRKVIDVDSDPLETLIRLAPRFRVPMEQK